MYEFSITDGFAEISENLADMIKFMANEPSVGLFYVQQHTQKATPKLVNLKNTIVDKSHEIVLNTEDLNDSITMIGSMKECGSTLADEMIKDIKASLSFISAKQPKRGSLNTSSSNFIERNNWSPSTWGHQDVENSGGYLSGVMKSVKKTGGGFKWSQTEIKENIQTEDLIQKSNELQEVSLLGRNSSNEQLVSSGEDYDEFKADRETKFEEWLGDKGNLDDLGVKKVVDH